MPQPRKHATPAQRQAAYRARTEAARSAQLVERGLPSLPSIPTRPGTPRWNAALRYVMGMLTTVQTEMQDYFEDRSESWQEGERGEAHQERLTSVEAALDALSDLSS
jgi:hypothetical protein